jgi:hypothetical protein
MNPSRLLSLTAFTAAAIALFPSVPSADNGLVAYGNQFALGLDTDADGLHDALEARLTTSWATPDSDSDGMDDFEEMAVGTHPLIPDQVGALVPEANLYADLYVVDGELVFQFAAFRTTSVSNIRLVIAGPSGSTLVPIDALIPFLSQNYSRSTSFAGWGIDTASFRLPEDLVINPNSSQAFALLARVDGIEMGYEIQLNIMNNIHVQVRDDLVSTGGGGGGVFPIEPGGQVPSAAVDQVCVQTLLPTGNDGNGTVFYTVTDASCEELTAAICMPGCVGSIDSTQVGIDILSWIN